MATGRVPQGNPLTRARVTDTIFDHSNFSNLTLRFADYTGCGFLHSRFAGARVAHTRFTNCYFRLADFTDAEFTNCVFADCNFDGAVFVRTRFPHSQFQNCGVTFQQLQQCLELHDVNLRRDLAQNLKVNAQNRGRSDDARSFLLVELRASEQHNWLQGWPPPESWQQRKYVDPVDRRAGKWQWAALVLGRFFWGHGERPLRVAGVAGLSVLAFAALYYFLPDIAISNMSQAGPANILDYLSFSLATLVSSNYGNAFSLSRTARVLTTVEASVGLVLLGFFVSALFRRISRR
jgi:hypothetical protein